jgi:hypothetical protein
MAPGSLNAFSREHGDWELLKKRGRLKGFEETW